MRAFSSCWLLLFVVGSAVAACSDDAARTPDADTPRGGASGSQARGGAGGSGGGGGRSANDAGGGGDPNLARGGTGGSGDTVDAGTAEGADSGAEGDASANASPLAGAELRYPVARGVVRRVSAGHGLLKGATDPDADVLRVTAIGALPVPEGSAAVSTATALGGSLSARADGSFDYTPPVGASPSLDEVAYSIGDGLGGVAATRVFFVLSPGALAEPGFEIVGDSGQFLAGNVVSGAGDFNGDGLDDIVVGARAGGRDQLHLVLGRAEPGVVDLGSEPPAVSFIAETVGLDDLGVAVSPAGRVNADSFDDLLIGVHQEPIGPGVADALGGKAYVVFGSASPPAVIELATLESEQRGFVIIGAAGQDHLGFSVSGAGNVDGVGGDDLVLGAIGRFPGEGESPTDGKAYVVFGKSTFSPVNLGSLGSGGFVMNGEVGTSGEAGVAVTGVGDWNADGLGDVAVSATKLNDAAGRVYVVYGKADTNAVSLGDIAADSAAGFAIDGEGDNDQAGRSLSRGGNLGGSALPDLVIGAPNPAGSGVVGKTYVVFGTSARERLSLSDVVLESGGDPARGFAIHAESGGDRSGLSASGVGDFDGDGVDDLLLGANESAVATTPDAGATSIDGAAYLVFGVSTPDADVSLLGLSPARGLTLRGQLPGNAHLGFSVSAAGDVNGDLHPDVIIGAPQHDGSTGRAYVLFGHP